MLIWLATSKDGIRWKPVWKPFIKPRAGCFDSGHVEMGPPPIKTKRGWLVLYHGVENKNGQIIYRLGYFILDLKNPAKLIMRPRRPILEPKHYSIKSLVDILPGGLKKMETMSRPELDKFIKKAETQHKLPKVLFCNGAILNKNLLRVYYGVGDTVICTATANINRLLNF